MKRPKYAKGLLTLKEVLRQKGEATGMKKPKLTEYICKACGKSVWRVSDRTWFAELCMQVKDNARLYRAKGWKK